MKKSEVLKRLRMEAQRAVRAIRDVEKGSVPTEFGLAAVHNSANSVITLVNLWSSGRLAIEEDSATPAEDTSRRGKRNRETVPHDGSNS